MEPWLAVLHYLAVFVTFALLLGEFVLLRLAPTGVVLKFLARLDVGYAVFAGLAIATGLSRVFWGEVPAAHWAGNPAFWMKMVLFGAVGALSVPPTMRYLSWNRAFEADGSLPDEVSRKKAGLFVHLELGLFLFIPMFAVIMSL